MFEDTFSRDAAQLSVFVPFLIVFDLLFILLRIALWPSAGKELSPWLFTYVVFIFSAVVVVTVPFPFWCLGQGAEFDCISS